MAYNASLNWRRVTLKECTVPCPGAGGSLVVFGLHGTAALASSHHEMTPDQALTHVPRVQPGGAGALRGATHVCSDPGGVHSPLGFPCVLFLLDLPGGLLFTKNI